MKIQNKHTSLQQRGIKLTNENTERIKEWEKYSHVLTGFSDWVGTAKSELSALYLFPVFLTEFLSLTGRFKVSDSHMYYYYSQERHYTKYKVVILYT